MSQAQISAVFCSILFLAHSAAAVAKPPACTIEEVKDPAVAGRALKIRLKNGTDVTIVGRMHGDRSITGDVMGLINRGATLSNADFKKRLEKIRADITAVNPEFKTSIDQTVQSDLAFLKRQLAQQPSTVVVDEGEKLLMEFNARELTNTLQAFETEVRGHGLPFGASEKRIFAASMGQVGGVLLALDPRRMERSRVTGYEDAFTADAARPLADGCDQALDKLQASLTQEELQSPWWKFLLQFDRITKVHANDGYTNLRDQNYHRLVTNTVPLIHQEAANQIVTACSAFDSGFKARERAVAFQLAKSQVPKVLFVGGMHLRSTMDLVKHNCETNPAEQNILANIYKEDLREDLINKQLEQQAAGQH